MLSTLRTRCPNCQATVKVSEGHIHKRVRCPKCKVSFDVSSVEMALSESRSDAVQADDTLVVAAADTSLVSDALHAAASSGRASPLGSVAAAGRAASPAKSLGLLGRFELREVLGQGAFGRVYRAYDPQLDREVALKVPTFGPGETRKIQRFITEAKAAARLRHPNIVPTFESGQADGQSYIAAGFVRGQTLSDRLKTQLAEFRQSAQWVRQLAEALAYAHGEGIVHRDIKPANVMLDGKGVPQIMDFGLAKRVNEDSGMTTDGSILGTPAYMSPEQARGEQAAVGPASDQYSLGVVLYELLTGRRPFEGPPHAVIAQVIDTEPPAPRSIRQDIPRDLEAICRQAIDKQAARRYASAADLALDLSHWLDGQPVRARSIRPWERVWKWSQRNPTAALFGATTALVIAIAFAAISAALSLALNARNQARANEATATRSAAELATALDSLKSEQAYSANVTGEIKRLDVERDRLVDQKQQLDQDLRLRQADLAQAQTKASEAIRAGESATRKAAAAEEQAQAALAKVASETQRAQRLLGQSYLDLGVRKYEAGQPDEAALWLARSLETTPPEATTTITTIRATLSRCLESTDEAGRSLAPQLLHALQHDHPVTAAAYQADGELLVSGDDAGGVHAWDPATGLKLFSAAGHKGAVRYVGFDPALGEDFATAGDDKTLVLWRLTADRRLAVQKKISNEFSITAAAWSNDGNWILAAGNQSRRMQLWAPATGRRIGDPLGEEYLKGRVFAAALVPRAANAGSQGSLAVLGTGGLEHTVRLWDLEKRTPVRPPIDLQADVLALAISPSGDLAAAGTRDKQVRLVNLAAWKAEDRRLLHQGEVAAIAFSSDQRTLLTGCQDRTAQLWDYQLAKPRCDAIPHGGPVTAVGFARDGDQFFTASEDKLVRLWSFPVLRQPRLVLESDRTIDAFALSPDGRRFVTASDRDLALWSVRSGVQIAECRDKTDAVFSLAFAPNGRSLAVGDETAGRLWNAQTLEPLGVKLAHEGRVLATAFSGDGRLVATGSVDRTAKVWRTDNQEPAQPPCEHPHTVTCVSLNQDGARLATGCLDDQVRVWTLAGDSKLLHSFVVPSRVHSLAWSSDGRLLAAACDTGVVLVWDAASGQALSAPLVHAGAARHAAFLPGQPIVATASRDGVQLWNVLDQRKLGVPTDTQGQVQFLGLSRDGTTLVAVAGETAQQVLAWQSHTTMRQSPAWIAAWVSLKTGRQLTADGAIAELGPAELEQLRTRLAELEAEDKAPPE